MYQRVKSDVGQVVVLCGGSEEESTSKLILFTGRVQFHSQFLEATHKLLATWLLPYTLSHWRLSGRAQAILRACLIRPSPPRYPLYFKVHTDLGLTTSTESLFLCNVT